MSQRNRGVNKKSTTIKDKFKGNIKLDELLFNNHDKKVNIHRLKILSENFNVDSLDLEFFGNESIEKQIRKKYIENPFDYNREIKLSNLIEIWKEEEWSYYLENNKKKRKKEKRKNSKY